MGHPIHHQLSLDFLQIQHTRLDLIGIIISLLYTDWLQFYTKQVILLTICFHLKSYTKMQLDQSQVTIILLLLDVTSHL